VRFINTAVAVIVALLVVLFAVSNRQLVTVEVWPFPFQVSLGLYAVILLAVLVGFVAGAVGAWMTGAKRRREHRATRKHVKQLEESLSRHMATTGAKVDSP